MTITEEELETKVARFFEKWSFDDLNDCARYFLEFLEIFQLDEEFDWDKEVLQDENNRNIKIIRCMYVMTKFADMYGSKLLATKLEFKSLWKKLEGIE